MPQMSPIMWTQLLMIITLNMMIINSMSYFSTIYKKTKKNKKKNSFYWKW
nr:ATP synthase F0 subunit 8 [Suva longipenna]WOW98934.1 ATP synthase F0 subunit 8 [Suva longipenna]